MKNQKKNTNSNKQSHQPKHLFNTEPVIDNEFDTGEIPNDSSLFQRVTDLLGRPYRMFENFIDKLKEWIEEALSSSTERDNAKQAEETKRQNNLIEDDYGSEAIKEMLNKKPKSFKKEESIEDIANSFAQKKTMQSVSKLVKNVKDKNGKKSVNSKTAKSNNDKPKTRSTT